MAKKPTTIRELVSSWTRNSGNNLALHSKLDLLELLNVELYSQYQPFAIKPDYIDRLFSWVDGAPSIPDKKLLFELASWLLFVGEEEMKSLYQSSYTSIITRWIIDQEKIDITADDTGDRIKDAMQKTFFGSIAGMDMGTYCRVNGIQGQSFRPDFREQASIGRISNLRKYLKDNRYSRIVAVEDYVGSGSQMEEACGCLSKLDKFPVLLCPMLAARRAVQKGTDLAQSHSHLDFEPLFPLPDNATIPAIARSKLSEPKILSNLRKALLRLWQQVQGQSPTQSLYGPFGFDETGSLTLTYLNCPDNVPPIIHHKSDTWEPLFRRASREG